MSSRSLRPRGRETLLRMLHPLGIVITRSSVFALVAALGGCASLPDGGMSLPAKLANSELHKEVVALRTDAEKAHASTKVAGLARRPLNAESAVQIALLNNRGLQAAYNELGVADAVRFQQSLPPNPSISFSRLAGSAELEIDRQIVTNILSLATLPTRSEIAEARFRQAQLSAALETFRVATETRREFYKAVAAQQTADLLQQATSASGTAVEIAKRLNETGGLTNSTGRARKRSISNSPRKPRRPNSAR